MCLLQWHDSVSSLADMSSSRRCVKRPLLASEFPKETTRFFTNVTCFCSKVCFPKNPRLSSDILRMGLDPLIHSREGFRILRVCFWCVFLQSEIEQKHIKLFSTLTPPGLFGHLPTDEEEKLGQGVQGHRQGDLGHLLRCGLHGGWAENRAHCNKPLMMMNGNCLQSEGSKWSKSNMLGGDLQQEKDRVKRSGVWLKFVF